MVRELTLSGACHSCNCLSVVLHPAGQASLIRILPFYPEEYIISGQASKDKMLIVFGSTETCSVELYWRDH